MCWEKSYANFTHLCQVTHYDLSVDHFCCCVIPHYALCCDYQRDSDEFRCRASTDSSNSASHVIFICLLAVATLTLLLTTACVCWNKVKNPRQTSRDSWRGQGHPLTPTAPPLEEEPPLVSGCHVTEIDRCMAVTVIDRTKNAHVDKC